MGGVPEIPVLDLSERDIGDPPALLNAVILRAASAAPWASRLRKTITLKGGWQTGGDLNTGLL